MARIGDRISFIRRNEQFEGIVEAVRDHSVIVEISVETARILKYETLRTVVKHSNYAVLQ
ncbi:DUF2187 family protein [Bacillus sp. J33]|uniref:DUF2187 family protein n=1 Tax=Bacillus sp. J33 TaxID=935836 RepID=UPI00047C3B1E|nr:DUF2187 family protein [Bacillus sp. J33]